MMSFDIVYLPPSFRYRFACCNIVSYVDLACDQNLTSAQPKKVACSDLAKRSQGAVVSAVGIAAPIEAIQRQTSSLMRFVTQPRGVGSLTCTPESFPPTAPDDAFSRTR